MTAFNKKEWLDAHVASIHPKLSMYAFFWNGHPPSEVLAYLVIREDDKEGERNPGDTWASAVRELVDKGFRFDVLREIAKVPKEEGGYALIFGGDGSPMFNKDGNLTARLFRKEDDGIALILEVGTDVKSGLKAGEAIKTLFESFDCDPLEVYKKYGTPFGAA